MTRPALHTLFLPGSSLAQALAYLRGQPQPVYLVGGCVRDMLLGRPTRDLDLTVQHGALDLTRRLADELHGAFVALDAARDTGRAIFVEADGSTVYVDCAGWRGATLADDLRLRDFTINALAVEVAVQNGEIIDVTGGVADLQQRLVRMTGEQALVDDPLRGLRAVRLLAELAPWSFRLEGDTEQALRRHAGLLARSAPERVRDELVRILAADAPETWLRLLSELGQMDVVLPEMAALVSVSQSAPHRFGVFEHSLGVVQHVSWQLRWFNGQATAVYWHEQALADTLVDLRPALANHFAQGDGLVRTRGDMWLWAALCHDWGKPATRSVEQTPGQPARIRFLGHEQVSAELATAALRRLRFNEAEIRRASVIVAAHLRPLELAGSGQSPSRRAVYRFFRDTGDAGVDVALLSLADLWATYGPDLPDSEWSQQLAVVRQLLDNYYERRDDTIAPPPLVDGNDLMRSLDLPPGRLIGRLLAQIAEAQAVGEVTTPEQALELAARLADQPANA